MLRGRVAHSCCLCPLRASRRAPPTSGDATQRRRVVLSWGCWPDATRGQARSSGWIPRPIAHVQRFGRLSRFPASTAGMTGTSLRALVVRCWCPEPQPRQPLAGRWRRRRDVPTIPRSLWRLSARLRDRSAVAALAVAGGHHRWPNPTRRRDAPSVDRAAAVFAQTPRPFNDLRCLSSARLDIPAAAAAASSGIAAAERAARSPLRGFGTDRSVAAPFTAGLRCCMASSTGGCKSAQHRRCGLSASHAACGA